MPGTAEPAGPVQRIEKAVVAESAPVETEPAVAPWVSKPVPVHKSAFAEDQLSVDADPETTLEGLALSDVVGLLVTVTVAEAFAEPPAPVHVTVYAVVLVGLTARVPLVATPPML